LVCSESIGHKSHDVKIFAETRSTTASRRDVYFPWINS